MHGIGAFVFVCVYDGIYAVRYTLSRIPRGHVAVTVSRYLHNRNAQVSVDSTNQYNLESDNCSVPAGASLPGAVSLRSDERTRYNVYTCSVQ